MDKYKAVKRGKIIYYLNDESVLVHVDGKCISYNVYNTPIRASLADFRKKITNSKEHEYGNALEQMDLARKCGLIGSSIKRPDWMVPE